MAELREIASGLDHEAVKGYTQLNKEHLLDALCAALGIDKHEHHEVVGLDKKKVKKQIKSLKKKRAEALTAHDHAQLKFLRRHIRDMKRKIKKASIVQH